MSYSEFTLDKVRKAFKICVNLPQYLIAAIPFAESDELEPLFS